MKTPMVLGLMMMVALAALAVGQAWSAAKSDKVFELRVYTTHDGRLDALNKRFREHTNKLFVKHGMKLVGYWVPTKEPASGNTLIYVLEHASQAAADKSWADFRADPVWHAARKASEEDGPIVAKVESTFMTATDYSPIK